jgi:hypothetical protein
MLNFCGIAAAILKMAPGRVIGHHWRSNSAFSKFSRYLPFSKWLPKHGIKMEGKHSTLSDIIKI